MAQSGRVESIMAGEEGGGGSSYGGDGGRERGTRRRKVYGYLKAANELRQTYSAQWMNQDMGGLDNEGIPGAFPDVEIARSGSEEMVLFPSYARRHIKKDVEDTNREGNGSDQLSDDEDYWRRELETWKHDTAVVDVDVRGWIYAPHRGQMTRKHRLAVALARRLSGIPAPSSSPEPDSMQSGPRTRTARQDEDLVRKEAQSIINRGEDEASAAWKGNYSRDPSSSSRSTSRSRMLETPDSDIDDGRGSATPPSRTTSQQTTMSREELSVANAHLMSRLRPFLADPRVSIPITVFFFNDEQSQSRTVNTNEAGHFSVRVPLDFVPTQIRVLASETLSAMEDVKIIEPRGISMISDIDDTIKHSAIASGAKEIFRNTFVRELEDLRVLGVEEWYSKLDKMGVRVHYVSNSPWQLYPLLRSYLNLVGLPPGSFHLKQYTGMLQGIFEPAAEKKKGSLQRIMRDFPERKFILVGDSGEADLEVYTDVVLANPGRVLGVFIRDVTTTEQKKFFDSSSGHLEQSLPRAASSGVEDSSDKVDSRPPLPPRKPPSQAYYDEKGPHTSSEPDLIDLNDESEPQGKDVDTLKGYTPTRAPPAKPSKPPALRTNTDTVSGNDAKDETEERIPRADAPPRRSVPPRPTKPRSLSSTREGIRSEEPPPLPPGPRNQPEIHRRQLAQQNAPQDPNTNNNAHSGPDDGSYRTSIKNKVTDVYNNLPSARSYWEGSGQSNPVITSNQNSSNFIDARAQAGRQKQAPPVPPPRRSGTASSVTSKKSSAQQQQQSYPAAAAGAVAQYASDHLSWKTPVSSVSTPTVSSQSTLGGTNNTSSSNYDNTYSSSVMSAPPAASPVPNKREEVWNRRWARAEEILHGQGVVLRSWRVGDDAQDVCVWLVEQAKKEMPIDEDRDDKG